MATGFRPASPPGSGEQVRVRYLDNLKVLLIAAIIVAHALVGYSILGGDAWAYSQVRETTFATPTFVVLLVLLLPFALFLIALLFLVAGLLTPVSFDRKGPGLFVRDRLLRLGVPYAVGTLLLWPALNYALYRPLRYETLSYWTEFVRDFPVGSVLWFVAVLLLLSLGYAAWRLIRPGGTRSRPVTVRLLLLVAGAVAVSSFLVRLVFPVNSYGVLGLHAWQWPEIVAMFAIGILAARQGWLAAVPAVLWHRARAATLLAAVGLAVFIALPLNFPMEYAAGGRHWQALLSAGFEGLLTVFGPIWLLSVAQRHLDRPLPHGAALARSCYGAFILQGIPLYAVAVAMRPVPVAAEIKALVVAVASVAGSFALSWLLVTRVPLLRRVL